MKYAKSAGKLEKNNNKNGALELWNFCGHFSFVINFVRLSLFVFIYFRVVLRKTIGTNNLWCATSNSNLENRVDFFASSCVLCATPAAHCRWRLMEWGSSSASSQLPFPFDSFPFRFHFDSIVAISVRWHCQRSTLMHTHSYSSSRHSTTHTHRHFHWGLR